MYDILTSFLSAVVVAFISACALLSVLPYAKKILWAYPCIGHVSYEDVLLTWMVSYTRWTALKSKAHIVVGECLCSQGIL